MIFTHLSVRAADRGDYFESIVLGAWAGVEVWLTLSLILWWLT